MNGEGIFAAEGVPPYAKMKQCQPVCERAILDSVAHLENKFLPQVSYSLLAIIIIKNNWRFFSLS